MPMLPQFLISKLWRKVHNLQAFWEEILKAMVVCLSDHHCCHCPAAVLSPPHWIPQTSLWCLVWVLTVSSECSLYTWSVWRHTERPVSTHMKKHSTLREHRKVSASVVLTDQMSSLLFSSSAPCTCSLTQYDPRGDEGTGRLKSLESTLLLALSGTSSGGTHRDVFVVMLTQDNLISDAAGDHLTV